MNDYISKITLDLNCKETPVVLFAGQYDVGRKIEVSVTADGESYSVNGCTAVCKGVNFAVDCDVDEVNNKVIITTDKNMLSRSGKVVARLTISDSTRSYSTQAFVVLVKSAFEGDITQSEKYSVLNDLINRVIQITESGGILVDTSLSADSNNPVSNATLTSLFDNKADKATTLAGYGITDAIKNEEGSVTRKNIDVEAVGTLEIEDGCITADLLATDVKNSFLQIPKKANLSESNNLLAIPDYEGNQNSAKLSAHNNHITINGTPYNNSTFNINLKEPYLSVDGTYTFSCQNIQNIAHATITLYGGSSGTDKIGQAIDLNLGEDKTFTVKNIVKQIRIWIPKDTVFENLEFDIQLEAGENVTAFNTTTIMTDNLPSESISKRHLSVLLRDEIFNNTYKKSEIDTKLSLKINTNKIATAITTSMDNTKLPNAGAIKAYLDNYYYGIDELYDMEQVDIFLSQKANVRSNANILKIPDFTETKNGVTLTASKNHITINGKTTANSTFRIILASPYLPINGTYTFSAQNADNNAHGSVTLYSGSASSTNITSAIAFENNSSTTFTADNTIRQIWIWLPQNTNFVNQQFDLQLEEGNTKTVFNLPTTLNEDLQSGSISQRHLDNTLRNKIFGDERILSKLISDAGFAGLIKSYCCIGDSLTEGFFDISNGAERDFEPSDFCSYPQQLKRITGASVLNYGISGSTAKPSDNSRSWLKQANAKGWLTSEDKSVGYIIALGVNDLILYSEFSGDVTTDINLTDYTQNAQTSVGGYAAIIQKIKGLQSDAKIFCVTLPNDRGASEIRTATNEKIKAIANLLGCYVIDLQNEWFSEEEREDFCAKYRNGGHWNAMGYNQLAKAYVTYIDHIISNNIDDFRNIQFVGTQMQYNS